MLRILMYQLIQKKRMNLKFHLTLKKNSIQLNQKYQLIQKKRMNHLFQKILMNYYRQMHQRYLLILMNHLYLMN
jgi:hypothetical protein